MVDMLTAAQRGRRFEDRVVLVTGVGAGAGLATVLRFAHEGARVVAVARSEANLTRAAEALASHGASFRTHRADVATELGAKEAVAEAISAFGGLDVLVNTAGAYEGGGHAETDRALLDRMLDANLRTAFETARAAVPAFRARGGGAIVITTAVFGAVVPGPGLLAYNTSKAAATGMVKSLAGDLAAQNIRVNAVLPGGITHKFEEGLDPAQGRALTQGPAFPQDIAAAAAFLASDEACWITGATLTVDGGFSVTRRPF